ncbi:MAG: hypothetical protein SWY16_04625 [Cyanobacteriota bacterium]|nr:hypothetical protein [Cyanobacteriota bacterium]
MSVDITALFVCLDDFSKLFEAAVKEKALPVAGESALLSKPSLVSSKLI